MIHRLRLKFIFINMAIVTAMLCVIFGLVIHFTGEALEQQSIQMMEQVVATPSLPGMPGRPGPGRNQVNLPYFILFVDSQGSVSVSNNSYYDLSDVTLVRELIAAAGQTADPVGLLKDYDLRYSRSVSPMGQLLVFADISSERTTMTGLIRTCLFIGIISFVVFLGISILLARWAVKPVAEAWVKQRQFVADASHELKTPLTVILTNAELLQSPDYGPEDKARFSGGILSMSYQMRGLVESLLELARVDNGAIKTSMAPLNLTELVSESVMLFEPLFFEAGLSLESHLEEGIAPKGSQTHLRQVTDILLDNAIKYSNPGGTARIDLRRHSGHALLSVSNTGPEISREDRKNIFKRFYRGDQARSMNHSYGLGLPIAESIVREHGGRIWVDSANGVNTFFVQLPL